MDMDPRPLDFTLALPPGYREADMLAYHGRDPLSLSERVAGRDVEAALRMGVALATARALSERLDELDPALIKAAQENIVVEAI